MTDKQINAILQIGDIHVTTLQSTLKDMTVNFPFTANYITSLSTPDLRTLETMTSRFGKLQDLMGTKIIDMYLTSESQPVESLSMLDKIHKLEKLKMLDNDELWFELRKVRNFIAHEYPDKPDLTAMHLNDVFKLAPVLIGIYQKLATAIRRLN